MAAVDYITLLGRVLHDGTQREIFRTDPLAFVSQSGLRETDRASFLRLSLAELETQARVLLCKRFELVRHVLPETCRRLGGDASLEFERYGQTHAPKPNEHVARDAAGFSEHLRSMRPEKLCVAEANRARFVADRRWLLFSLVPVTPSKRSARVAVQVLIRGRCGRWRESLWFFAV